MQLVYCDTETGGLDDSHPTIQIAAVAIDRWSEVDSFEAKIQFREEDADPEALKLNSYDHAMWAREAKPESEFVAAFGEFLRRHSHCEMVSKRTGRPYSVARLAGHNADRFDGPRLRAMFKRHGAFLPAHPQVMDTLQLALWKTEGALKSYRLEELCGEYGIPVVGAHDALADVRMCVQLARVLIDA